VILLFHDFPTSRHKMNDWVSNNLHVITAEHAFWR
jgi:hypothetical protein